MESIKAEQSNVNLEPWNTMQIAFAFHSKDQDIIFNQVNNSEIDWTICKKLGIPIWLKETEKLKQIIEGVAKTVYRRAADDVGLNSRAATTALWYIVIDKKSILCNLYRTEPNNKRIFDLLSNDFSEQRWQKAADKNAMVLVSKKNYELGIAFFLLAGKIKDALAVAIGKMKDINLAILIARLVDGYESDSLYGLIDKYFIDEGKDMDDPWLVSIGYWWKKQYFDSINTLSSMIEETKLRLSRCVFNREKKFNLYRENAVIKNSYEKTDDSRTPTVETSLKQTFEYPIISGRNAFVLDFIEHLMDHHIVKRAIRDAGMDEDSDESGDGGDIFDDFFGQSATKKKEEKKTKENHTIDVNKETLLSIISDYYSDKGFVLLGLVLAYENKDLNMKRSSADNLVKNIIVEVVKGTKADNSDSTEKVTRSIDELVSRFKLNKDDYFIFVRNQYRFLENLRLEFRFIKHGKDSSTLLFRLEEELLKSVHFINVMTAYPFAIDLEKNLTSLRSICSLIEYLEDVVECLFIYENEANDDETNQKFEEDKFARQSSKTVKQISKPTDIKIEKKKSRGSNRIQVRDTISLKKPGKHLKDLNTQDMAMLCCKLRTSYLLYISMILLSFLIKKFEYIRPLLTNLQSLIKLANLQATDSDNLRTGLNIQDKLQSLANIQIYLKSLKDITNGLLSKAEGKDKINDGNNSDSSEDDPFLKNMRIQQEDKSDEAKQKQKLEEEAKAKSDETQRKLDQFMILWLRQIVIYNTHYVLHLAVTNLNMMSILDVRPSIVKATSIKYSLVSLMNPRLQTIQQLNNFKSMKRVLDNIVTYFFQNFFSVRERAMVVEDLHKYKNSMVKINYLKNLNFKGFFESDEEFKKFCSFMDMNYYISNVCDFELGLIKHSNKDYSPETLKRVQEMYKNGVDIFKNSNEHITEF